MATSNKILLQDKSGNKYYPHTMADIVHVTETKTMYDLWLEEKTAFDKTLADMQFITELSVCDGGTWDSLETDEIFDCGTW